MYPYIDLLTVAIRNAGIQMNINPRKNYMKDRFDFPDIKSPGRKILSRTFFNRASRPPAKRIGRVIRELWILPEREFLYFAMELFSKYDPQ